MEVKWSHRKAWNYLLIAFLCAQSIASPVKSIKLPVKLDEKLKTYIDRLVAPGINVERQPNPSIPNPSPNASASASIEAYFQRRLSSYLLSVNLSEAGRFFSGSGEKAAADKGKSSFLTGFGMGFLAFGLKKLLLPVFIGAQLIKSVLIAMFLPSILGGVGKLLGKGLSSFSGISGASNGNKNNQIDDFDFKDVANPYGVDEAQKDGDGFGLNSITSSPAPTADSRFGVGNHRVSYLEGTNENYYMRRPNKKTDYKVFHKIPSSSLLLTSYDPFYSPLLSRLDAVFQQLGLGSRKSSEMEKCRERLVCMMYANPAKYAPYSNLVSAQLSRELNELRKPSSDNPDILRFFRYMKAAKDGQDGEECLAHRGCPSLTSNQPSPAILTTFNDINKLVQARKFN